MIQRKYRRPERKCKTRMKYLAAILKIIVQLQERSEGDKRRVCRSEVENTHAKRMNDKYIHRIVPANNIDTRNKFKPLRIDIEEDVRNVNQQRRWKKSQCEMFPIKLKKENARTKDHEQCRA